MHDIDRDAVNVTIKSAQPRMGCEGSDGSVPIAEQQYVYAEITITVVSGVRVIDLATFPADQSAAAWSMHFGPESSAGRTCPSTAHLRQLGNGPRTRRISPR